MGATTDGKTDGGMLKVITKENVPIVAFKWLFSSNGIASKKNLLNMITKIVVLYG